MSNEVSIDTKDSKERVVKVKKGKMEENEDINFTTSISKINGEKDKVLVDYVNTTIDPSKEKRKMPQKQ